MLLVLQFPFLCTSAQIFLDISPVMTIALLDGGHLFHLSDSIKLHRPLKLNAHVLLQKLIPTIEKLCCYFNSFNEVENELRNL